MVFVKTVIQSIPVNSSEEDDMSCSNAGSQTNLYVTQSWISVSANKPIDSNEMKFI